MKIETSDYWGVFTAPHPMQGHGVSCSAALGALFTQSGIHFINLTKYEQHSLTEEL